MTTKFHTDVRALIAANFDCNVRSELSDLPATVITEALHPTLPFLGWNVKDPMAVNDLVGRGCTPQSALDSNHAPSGIRFKLSSPDNFQVLKRQLLGPEALLCFNQDRVILLCQRISCVLTHEVLASPVSRQITPERLEEGQTPTNFVFQVFGCRVFGKESVLQACQLSPKLIASWNLALANCLTCRHALKALTNLGQTLRATLTSAMGLESEISRLKMPQGMIGVTLKAMAQPHESVAAFIKELQARLQQHSLVATARQKALSGAYENASRPQSSNSYRIDMTCNSLDHHLASNGATLTAVSQFPNQDSLARKVPNVGRYPSQEAASVMMSAYYAELVLCNRKYLKKYKELNQDWLCFEHPVTGELESRLYGPRLENGHALDAVAQNVLVGHLDALKIKARDRVTLEEVTNSHYAEPGEKFLHREYLSRLVNARDWDTLNLVKARIPAEAFCILMGVGMVNEHYLRPPLISEDLRLQQGMGVPTQTNAQVLASYCHDNDMRDFNNSFSAAMGQGMPQIEADINALPAPRNLKTAPMKCSPLHIFESGEAGPTQGANRPSVFIGRAGFVGAEVTEATAAQWSYATERTFFADPSVEGHYRWSKPTPLLVRGLKFLLSIQQFQDLKDIAGFVDYSMPEKAYKRAIHPLQSFVQQGSQTDRLWKLRATAARPNEFSQSLFGSLSTLGRTSCLFAEVMHSFSGGISITQFVNSSNKVRRDLSDSFWKAWAQHSHRRPKVRVPPDFDGIMDTLRYTPFSLVPALAALSELELARYRHVFHQIYLNQGFSGQKLVQLLEQDRSWPSPAALHSVGLVINSGRSTDLKAYSNFSHITDVALDPVLQDAVLGTRWMEPTKPAADSVGKTSSAKEESKSSMKEVTKSSGKKDEPIIHVEVSTPNSAPVTITSALIDSIDPSHQFGSSARGRGGPGRGGKKGY